jgi:hypothetical protein
MQAAQLATLVVGSLGFCVRPAPMNEGLKHGVTRAIGISRLKAGNGPTTPNEILASPRSLVSASSVRSFAMKPKHVWGTEPVSWKAFKALAVESRGGSGSHLYSSASFYSLMSFLATCRSQFVAGVFQAWLQVCGARVGRVVRQRPSSRSERQTARWLRLTVLRSTALPRWGSA